MGIRVGSGGFAMLVGLVFASVAQAGDYTVQIGAFRSAPADFAAAAERVGALHTTQTEQGVTRYRIGDYASKDEAESARAALVEAGYTDAFVIRARGGRRASTSPTSTEARRPGSRSGDPLAGLPAELRARIVLLDGAYHVKDGDRFIPLEEALRAEGLR